MNKSAIAIYKEISFFKEGDSIYINSMPLLNVTYYSIITPPITLILSVS